MLVAPMIYIRPGTPMKPPTAMVAASIPVARATGMRNHMLIRRLAVLQLIIGHSSICCSLLASGEPAGVSPVDFFISIASCMTNEPTMTKTMTKMKLT